MSFTGLGSTDGQALLDRLNSSSADQDRNSSRMSTTTFNLDNDEEYEASKGVRGIFNKIFKKKKNSTTL